jgi:hypothetical protein
MLRITPSVACVNSPQQRSPVFRDGAQVAYLYSNSFRAAQGTGKTRADVSREFSSARHYRT